MKKSHFIIFAIILVFGAFAASQAQAQGEVPEVDMRPCQGRTLIGVEVVPQGFDNPVEAKIMIIKAFNKDLLEATQKYCVVPTAGTSSRKLVVRVNFRTVETQRGGEEPIEFVKRAGIQTAANILIGKLPSRVQNDARRTERQYAPTPYIYLRTVEVTAVASMYQGKTLLWEGNSSRVFLIQETRYSGGLKPNTVEYAGNQNPVGELRDIIPVPNKELGRRYPQISKMVVAREALQLNNRLLSEAQIAQRP